MARKGKDFELLYKSLYELDKNKYTVTSPGYLWDPFAERKREIDVLVQYDDKDGNRRSLAIECRDRGHKENVMWIEQLQQKKEDLSLDYILATTTCDFTQSAINKARKHGVIIEKATTFSVKTIDKIVNDEFFQDIFFCNYVVDNLTFVSKDNQIMTLKELLKSSNIFISNRILKELHYKLYININPHDYLERFKISNDTFFKNNQDNSITINDFIDFKRDKSTIFNELNIKTIYIQLKIIPFRLSLPLNKSLSVLDVETNNNKKYCAIFGDDEENIEFGYIEKDLYCNVNLKHRKYSRLIGGTMTINNIFPEVLNEPILNWDKIFAKYIGELDFRHIL